KSRSRATPALTPRRKTSGSPLCSARSAAESLEGRILAEEVDLSLTGTSLFAPPCRGAANGASRASSEALRQLRQQREGR
ncbi:unnamed protein product, partial [Polarella glacialis]